MAEQQAHGVTVNVDSGNGFTNKEILVRLENKVDKVLDDHENRIRSVESSSSRMKGALGILTIVFVPAVAIGATFIHP